MYKKSFNVFANVTQSIPKNVHLSGFGGDDTTPTITFEKDKMYEAIEVNSDYLVARGTDGEEYRIGGDGDGTDYWDDSDFKGNFRLAERPIKVIETDIWEADPEKKGYLRLVRLRTIEEVYREVVQFLKEQFLHDRLEHFSIINDEVKEFPKWRWVACYAVTGGSEGHYIHVDAITNDGKTVQIFLGKTFLGMNFALEVSNALTKVFWDEMK